MDMPIILRATSAEGVQLLSRRLTCAILAEGGWVLSRMLCDGGLLEISFEFERRACIEMYTALVGAGVEMSADSHWRLAELCHCTRHLGPRIAKEPASVFMTIQARHQRLSPPISFSEAQRA